MAFIGFQGCISEDIVKLAAGTISHILLPDGLDMITDVGMLLFTVSISKLQNKQQISVAI